MANYMLVNSDQLDADLKTVADSIRGKTGKSEELSFPNGMKDAIESIPDGATVQKTTGTFNTGNDGTASVNCGFKPDIVYIYNGNYSNDGHTIALVYEFNVTGKTKLNSMMWENGSQDAMPIEIGITQTSNGFNVIAGKWGENWNSTYYRGSFSYIAAKYT